MLAIALDDFDIVIVDIDTRRVVRKFAGHHSTITDMVSVSQIIMTKYIISILKLYFFVNTSTFLCADFQLRFTLADDRRNGCHRQNVGPTDWQVV